MLCVCVFKYIHKHLDKNRKHQENMSLGGGAPGGRKVVMNGGFYLLFFYTKFIKFHIKNIHNFHKFVCFFLRMYGGLWR